MSLLAQARKVLDETAGSEFIQLRENGADTKRYGVSMLHQLHCLELLRSSAVSGCRSTSHAHQHKGRDMNVGEIDHIEHCFQYLAQVSELSSIITELTYRYPYSSSSPR
jgi:hypothetical protein